MAFNFGAFAGGLAQGIQKGTELKQRQQQLEQDAINKTIEQNNKLAKQYADNKKVVTDKTSKLQTMSDNHRKEILDIMSKKGLSANDRRDMYNEAQRAYKSSLDTLTNNIYGSEVSNLTQDDLNSVNGQVANAYNNLDATEYTPVKIGDKEVNLPLDVAQKYVDNPDGYTLRNGVLFDKINDQPLASSKTFELVADKKSDKATGYDTGLTSSMSEDEIDYFTKKGINPDNVSRLTLQAYRKYQMSSEKKTDFDKKVEFINKQGNIIQGAYDNTIDVKDITKTDIAKLRTAEKLSGDKGLGETEKKFIRDSEQTLATGKRLVETLDAIGNEEIERGVFDNIKSTAYNLFSDKAWEGLSKDEKQKHLLTIGVNTKIGNALAQYIKSISGTAVAEAEYDRLLKVFATGNYSNIQSLKESINTFYDDLAEAHATRLNDNLLEGGSFVLDKLKTHRERFGNKKPIEQKATTEKDMAMQTLKSSDKGDIASGLDVIYDEKAVSDYYANKENPSYTPSFENKIDINGTETRLQDALDLYSSGYFDKVDIYVKDYNTGEVNLYQKGKAPNKLKNSIVSKEAYIEILDRIAYGGTKKQTSKYSNVFR